MHISEAWGQLGQCSVITEVVPIWCTCRRTTAAPCSDMLAFHSADKISMFSIHHVKSVLWSGWLNQMHLQVCLYLLAYWSHTPGINHLHTVYKDSPSNSHRQYVLDVIYMSVQSFLIQFIWPLFCWFTSLSEAHILLTSAYLLTLTLLILFVIRILKKY